MTADVLTDMHESSGEYLRKIVLDSTTRAIDTRDPIGAMGFEASAALLASLSMLSRALKMRPQGQPENDLKRLVWAAVDLTLDAPGAADALLPQLERFA